MPLTNKTVLVTGASRGIGRAVAIRCAEEGASVVVHYRNDLAAARESMRLMKSGRHLLLQAELGNPDEVEALVERTVQEFGSLDVVVNNAGIYELHDITLLTYEQWRDVWRRTLETNLVGPANLTYCAVQRMMQHGGGKLVNISSRGAFRGEPVAAAYGAAKAGLNSLGQSMAQALASRAIYVYTIAPGFVETDMIADLLQGPDGEAYRQQSPMGRTARPEEIANIVLFLASDGSEYLTGCIIDANGASYLRT